MPRRLRIFYSCLNAALLIATGRIAYRGEKASALP